MFIRVITALTLQVISKQTFGLAIGLLMSLSAGLMASSATYAEVIQIPVASQANDLQSVPRPERGSSKEQVLAEYGDAVNIIDSVGQPPISRWEYQDFYVVFESNFVIHSVLKHRPKHMP